MTSAAHSLALFQSNSRALWYLTRGFGLVSLVLLTTTLVLGLTQAVRYARPGLPRFVVSALHKNASLLAVTAISIHVVTAVADSYAPIRVVDAFVPFISRYRPIWTGLGALALDLVLALVATSILRERLGHATWRAVHWIAYACWPVALVHGIGTGSDIRLGWVWTLDLVCTLAVIGALCWRVRSDWSPASAGQRVLVLAAGLAFPVIAGVWAVTGPFQPGWARRAGTPQSLLSTKVEGRTTGSGQRSIPAVGSRSAASGAQSQRSGWSLPFVSAAFIGQQSVSPPDQQGLISVTIRGGFSGAARGELEMVLTGQPIEGGGVSMTRSGVVMGSPTDPTLYRGRVVRLEGSTVVASLTDASGSPLVASISLELQPGASAVGGHVSARP
jgi:hypothetical protein